MGSGSRGCGRIWLVAIVACVVLARGAWADTLRGTVRRVSPRTRQLVVADRDGDDNRFAVSRSARIVLDGKPAKLADLRAGDRVAVAFHEDASGRAVATGITATRKTTGTGSPPQHAWGDRPLPPLSRGQERKS